MSSFRRLERKDSLNSGESVFDLDPDSVGDGNMGPDTGVERFGRTVGSDLAATLLARISAANGDSADDVLATSGAAAPGCLVAGAGATGGVTASQTRRAAILRRPKQSDVAAVAAVVEFPSASASLAATALSLEVAATAAPPSSSPGLMLPDGLLGSAGTLPVSPLLAPALSAEINGEHWRGVELRGMWPLPPGYSMSSGISPSSVAGSALVESRGLGRALVRIPISAGGGAADTGVLSLELFDAASPRDALLAHGAASGAAQGPPQPPLAPTASSSFLDATPPPGAPSLVRLGPDGLLARSRWIDLSGSTSWRPCRVRAYAPELQRFLIDWMDGGRQRKWVSRYNLLFDGEVEDELLRRVAVAEVRARLHTLHRWPVLLALWSADVLNADCITVPGVGYFGGLQASSRVVSNA
jgi:hypothetical protein